MPRAMFAAFKVIKACRFVIPLMWMAVVGCGVKWGPAFFDNLEDNLNSKVGSKCRVVSMLC